MDIAVSTPDDSQQAPVPGSPTAPVATGENLGTAQPEAPLPAPATAAPAQDAVTVNTSWSSVSSSLQTVIDYINTVLAFDPLSESVIADVEAIISNIS